MPTELFFGPGSMKNILDFEEDRILICADPFLKGTDMLINLVDDLIYEGKIVTVFTDIIPDSPISVIMKIINRLDERECNLIITIGGGSALDATKSARYFYEQINGVRIPLVAVPTTSGTGSEVTNYVVVKDDKTHQKIPLANDLIYPDYAIVDPNCVRTMPKPVARDTGLDVLTHAIEAYVATGSNVFTKTYALEAIEIILDNLEDSVMNSDFNAQTKVHYGATMAGIAFGQAGLGMVHAMSHAIGGRFSIPHGRANGILLPYLISYLGNLDESIYSDLMDRLHIEGFSIDCRLNNFIKKINNLRESLNLPNSFRDLGIEQDEFLSEVDELSKSAFNDLCSTASPIHLNQDQISEVYKNAFLGNM